MCQVVTFIFFGAVKLKFRVCIFRVSTCCDRDRAVTNPSLIVQANYNKFAHSYQQPRNLNIIKASVQSTIISQDTTVKDCSEKVVDDSFPNINGPIYKYPNNYILKN